MAEKEKMTATNALRASPAGPVLWGWAGRTASRRTDRSDGGQSWLRLMSAPTAQAGGKLWEGNRSAQQAFGALSGHRAQLLDLHDWTDGPYSYRAELSEYVPDEVCSPTPALNSALDLPDAWWTSLRHSLETVARGETDRVAVRQEWADRAVPRELGIPAPALGSLVAVHGDLHWANLTRQGPHLLDWEGWGLGPACYDQAMLHIYSLSTPDTAKRVRVEFPELDSPQGLVAETVVTTELLQSIARGDFAELADAVNVQADRLRAAYEQQ